MNDLKIKTLEQVHNALDAIEEQRADSSLKTSEKLILEEASVTLRNIERSIIREKEQDMVSILENDSKGLEELNEKIKQASAKFEGLAATIGKACRAVEGLIKIITTAVGAGLL